MLMLRLDVFEVNTILSKEAEREGWSKNLETRTSGNDMQLIARQNSPASPLSPKSAKTPQSPKPPMVLRGKEWGREKWDQLRIGSGQGYR